MTGRCLLFAAFSILLFTGCGPSATREIGSTNSIATYHVRIMTFGSAPPRDADSLRGYLERQGIETELKQVNQAYVLFSQEQSAEKAQAEALAVRINQALRDFAKLTRKMGVPDAFAEPIE
jgi:hypothetical protein